MQNTKGQGSCLSLFSSIIYDISGDILLWCIFDETWRSNASSHADLPFERLHLLSKYIFKGHIFKVRMARNCCSTESVWKKAHKREGCAHSNLAFILSDICITVFFKIQAVYHHNYFCLSCTLCSFTTSTTALFVIWGFKQQKNPNNKKNIKSIWHREPVDNNLGITISLRLACYLALPFKNAILLKWVKLHGLYSS